jgi:methylmalonyl-CoA/ethylmalonyl-CoA epimerase
MWVDNLAEAEAQVKAAGGKHLHGRPPDRPNTFYEVKYADPDGVVFDLTESGWKGAQKNVVPAK